MLHNRIPKRKPMTAFFKKSSLECPADSRAPIHGPEFVNLILEMRGH